MEEPHVAWRKVGAEGHAIFKGVVQMYLSS